MGERRATWRKAVHSRRDSKDDKAMRKAGESEYSARGKKRGSSELAVETASTAQL